MVTQVIEYITEDGSRFKTREAAEQYERADKLLENLLGMVEHMDNLNSRVFETFLLQNKHEILELWGMVAPQRDYRFETPLG